MEEREELEGVREHRPPISPTLSLSLTAPGPAWLRDGYSKAHCKINRLRDLPGVPGRLRGWKKAPTSKNQILKLEG